MNLKPHSQSQIRSVALVITLLMLSVITFLAIAFLAMTSRDKSAVTATLDMDTAKSMSDAALARAEAQIAARIMAANDVLSFDYMASHNYIGNGYTNTENYYDPANVNYDTLGGSTSPYWVSNIANLFWDPRPPVFVMTNNNVAQPLYDFRYWVDINRNGMFESNGTISNIAFNGLFDGTLSNYSGEPEWIGVLKYPETNHSQSNPFTGRFAFMVLPIGKTLDWNFIHNYGKFAGAPSGPPAATPDGFVRDEGVGSWELNLAGLLNDINSNMYPETGPPGVPYNYILYNPEPYPGGLGNASPNTGYAFNDAYQFVAFRYATGASYPQTLDNVFGVISGNPAPYGITNIDEYGCSPSLTYPFDYNQILNAQSESVAVAKMPWAGSYSTNWIYDVQDLFDPTKAGSFAARMTNNNTNIDTYDRYTMQRLLGSIGTSSSPEYGVYVYGNTNIITAVPTPPPLLPAPFSPTLLRTKVNINYDNTAQIQAGPYDQNGKYTPMPTNLVGWTNNAIGFFTNAADLLLRSQVYVYTNYLMPFPGQFVQSNYLLYTFGITNIPIYAATNPGIVYNDQVHRMLQLAANIYADTYPNYTNYNGVYYQLPPIFRPQFQVITGSGPNGPVVSNIYITNYVLVTNAGAYTQIVNPAFPNVTFQNFKDLTNSTIQPNDNIWGIPWVVGAVKGLPEFDQYSYQFRVFYQRALQFVRHTPYMGSTNLGDPTQAPQYTNIFYEMCVSNVFALDAWNPSTNAFTNTDPNGSYVFASNYTVVTITNNFGFGTNIPYGTYALSPVTQNFSGHVWPGQYFPQMLSNVFISLPYGYFSEYLQNFYSLTNPSLASVTTATATNGITTYLPQDMTQTTTSSPKFKSHYWTISVTNHFFYALFDGNPLSPSGSATLLDFVNIGPFGSSCPITAYLNSSTTDPFNLAVNGTSGSGDWWTIPSSPSADNGTFGIPPGVSNQINGSITGTAQNRQWYQSLQGNSGADYPSNVVIFGMPTAMSPAPQYNAIGPYADYFISNSIMACDPLVHYTIQDLSTPAYIQTIPTNVWSGADQFLNTPMSVGTGRTNLRYVNGINVAYNGYSIFTDPGMTNSDAWQFPNTLFPTVGWLGRVHRGTPWQTVYLKSDDTAHGSDWINNNVSLPNNKNGAAIIMPWVNSPFTYPTNDWSLVDLFTAVPNDNAARGLLSVNQTNDAAWAAVFAGVIAQTNATAGTPIDPYYSVPYIMDYSLPLPNPNYSILGTNGINIMRTFQTNGLYHHIGDILQASTLTINSPFIQGIPFNQLNDEMVERIPQQTLGLLKLGMPQFVIYAWGQSLKPKNIYTGGGPFTGICTNYEITGEYLTRTVCHLAPAPPGAPDPTPKLIIDSYNIEPQD